MDREGKMGAESTEIMVRSSSAVAAQTEGLPALITHAGDQATKRFIEFFTAQIPNANTRAAYFRATSGFLSWADSMGLSSLAEIEPVHVSTYREQLGQRYSVPTVKQHLAAIRMLFDWLVIGQIVPSNPASSVRGPKYSIRKGKTPILGVDEARELLDSIRTDTVVGLRDRALIATLTYSFARISAALAMNVEDCYEQSRRLWLRLHEKGGKHHEMPAHHKLEEYLHAYIQEAGLADEPKAALFRSARGRTGLLTANRLDRNNARMMIKRRAADAGISTRIGCHTFRGTGITAYLENGGTLEKAQLMAAHESPRTTKIYDRTSDQVTLDEIERIGI